jgi:hypothetical protein
VRYRYAESWEHSGQKAAISDLLLMAALAEALERHPMALELYLGFVAAVTVLMLIPGPNVARIVANSVRYGAHHGLLTIAGTSTAMVVQLVVAALGMTALLSALPN